MAGCTRNRRLGKHTLRSTKDWLRDKIRSLPKPWARKSRNCSS